ncbi:hypothetical protein FRX31_002410 [Thalictrum thalictroides]|uniref:Uncharacterized protein n=1 Tax=Thalictrum thalictroides TaxID=46969 RepID=A0A7J6XEQ3_THATH|nr:hypothetical protein FRX31_002410 [Thalictrum thalictroides]
MTETRSQKVEASVKNLETRLDEVTDKQGSLQGDVKDVKDTIEEMKGSMEKMNAKFDFLFQGMESLLELKGIDPGKVEAAGVPSTTPSISPAVNGSVTSNGILGHSPGSRANEGNIGSASKFHEFQPRPVVIPHKSPDTFQNYNVGQ